VNDQKKRPWWRWIYPRLNSPEWWIQWLIAFLVFMGIYVACSLYLYFTGLSTPH